MKIWLMVMALAALTAACSFKSETVQTPAPAASATTVSTPAGSATTVTTPAPAPPATTTVYTR
jgi:hypothetical protein